jgi:hypothetical protein
MVINQCLLKRAIAYDIDPSTPAKSNCSSNTLSTTPPPIRPGYECLIVAQQHDIDHTTSTEGHIRQHHRVVDIAADALYRRDQHCADNDHRIDGISIDRNNHHRIDGIAPTTPVISCQSRKRLWMQCSF